MRRIVLDTDLAMGAPGSDVDDGFALALALADPELAVELVTTVNGNTDVDTATSLTGELLRRLGRTDVPVARGAGAPLLAKRHIRVPDGAPPPPRTAGSVDRHAATEIVERVMAEPGRLTIVAIGPLTNVALALLLEPRIAQAVEEVVVMGGVFLGHTGVAAMPGEFNFWTDPHAVAVVLDSGAPLRFVGLDVTRQVRLTREHAARMASSGDFGRFAGEATQHWIDHQERVMPGDELERGSCALHDPLAVAVLTRPDLVTWRDARVTVEVASETTAGVVVTDLLHAEHPPAANCRIATAVDVDAFTDLFVERVGRLG
jgi:purine nucleosidase